MDLLSPRFTAPARRKSAENLLPMINVVFLLLIFFLIAARLAPAEAVAVQPPEGRAVAEAEGLFTLLVAADGTLAWQARMDEAALQGLAAARGEYCMQADCAATPPRLTLRADSRLPAARLAALLPRIAGLGFGQVELAVVPGPVAGPVAGPLSGAGE